MTRVEHHDVGELAAPARTPEGYLRAEGRLARVGLQSYRDAQGKDFIELRLPDEVFDQASLESFHLVPVTNLHPPGLLTAGNAKLYAVGSVGPARRDGDHVVASLMITDADAIRAIEGGRTELSVGYGCELAPADPSLFSTWGRHDAIQRGIVVNHVALVDVARCGPTCSLKADCETCNQQKEKPNMSTNSSTSDEITDLKKQLDAERARADAAEGRLAVLQNRQTLDEQELRSRYDVEKDERVQAEVLADRLGVHRDAVREAKTMPQLRRVLLAKVDPRLDVAGKSDAWISAALEFAVSQIPNASQALRGSMGPFVRDAAPSPWLPSDDPQIARQRSIERSRIINATGLDDGGDAPSAPPRQYLDGEQARAEMIQRLRDRYQPGSTEGARTSPTARKRAK